MTAVLPGEPQVEAPVRPELTISRVRHYLAVGMVCVWCERPIIDHIRKSRDGFRWVTAGDCVNPVPLRD